MVPARTQKRRSRAKTIRSLLQRRGQREASERLGAQGTAGSDVDVDVDVADMNAAVDDDDADETDDADGQAAQEDQTGKKQPKLGQDGGTETAETATAGAAEAGGGETGVHVLQGRASGVG